MSVLPPGFSWKGGKDLFHAGSGIEEEPSQDPSGWLPPIRVLLLVLLERESRSLTSSGKQKLWSE